MTDYDLAVIGSGPGGYVAALYAAAHGLRVCVVEKGLLGGTCLNAGCIPTKTMLHSAELVSRIRESSHHGVDVPSHTVNFKRIIERRDDVVFKLRAGIEALFRARKIALVKGTAALASPNTLRIDGSADIRARNVIIAAGSVPARLPAVEFDETSVLTSDGILKMNVLPKSLAIIGGGIVGCEFASLFNDLGVSVTVIELLDRLIPTQSRETAKKLEAIFRKKGISVMTSSRVASVTKGPAVTISLGGGATAEAEKALIAVGRRPATEGLGLESLGIKTENGRIAVDGSLRTSVASVFAIGDCVEGPQLAHKASYDGMVACDNILGNERKADYSSVPSCVYTDPEIAIVGLTEEEARERHPDAKIAKFHYLSSGKAFLMGRHEGFIKLIGNSKHAILGVEIMGEGACELISEAVLAKSSNLTIDDLARAVHPHPSISEIFQEAAHIFRGKAIHSI
jgi:dihydrolipoamide dehydrogenase